MKVTLLPILCITLTVVACSSDDADSSGSGSSDNCPADFGYEFGGGCDDNGDSSAECDPGVSCDCDGVTHNTYICFDGQCVTSMNCDAWCAASDGDRMSCM